MCDGEICLLHFNNSDVLVSTARSASNVWWNASLYTSTLQQHHPRALIISVDEVSTAADHRLESCSHEAHM